MRKELEFNMRKSVMAKLSDYDTWAKEDDIIEVTEWASGDGWDISICRGDRIVNVSFTWGELRAIKKLIKELDNYKLKN